MQIEQIERARVDESQLVKVHDFLVTFPVEPSKMTRVMHIDLESHLRILTAGQRSFLTTAEGNIEPTQQQKGNAYESFHKKRWELFQAIFNLMFQASFTNSSLESIVVLATELSEINKVFLPVD